MIDAPNAYSEKAAILSENDSQTQAHIWNFPSTSLLEMFSDPSAPPSGQSLSVMIRDPSAPPSKGSTATVVATAVAVVEQSVLLSDLTSDQLLNLMLHCKLSPSVIYSIKEQNINGSDLANAVNSEKDLMDIGIKLLPARALHNRIVEWKESGLPHDFILDSAAAPEAEQRNVIQERRAQTYTAYYEARFCGNGNSFFFIQQQAQDGDLLAEAYLGALVAFGCTAAKKDTGKATQCFTNAAEFLHSEADKGCQYAQHIYGFALAYGVGMAQNEAEAVRYYKLAADQGHANAQTALGKALGTGVGVAVNRRDAVRYYKLAAKQGHALAQCTLGWCYAEGMAVGKKPAKAVHYYTLAADQGYADAQCNLAVCYQNGKGVKKNGPEAARLFKLAADQGQVQALNGLGYLFANGIGLERNEYEAVGYYKLAADQGHSVAQYNLAICFANGTGVAQDEAEAARYFKLAAEHGAAQQQAVECTVCGLW